jgi:branched-chain amino acid transport system ATP-binding protein
MTSYLPAPLARVPLLCARQVIAGYGQSKVLQGVNLDVGVGETVGLLGRNGVGRSTLLKAIMRLVQGCGSIRMGETEIGAAPTHVVTRAGIAYVPEDRAIFPDLTVRENMAVGKRGHNFSGYEHSAGAAWSEEEFLDMFPNLKRRANTAGGVLSGGEQQMLTICRALMGRPRLILIDEPTEGLSLAMVEQVATLLREVARRGVAIVLVEQKLTIALQLCDRVNVMGHGRIVFDGSVAAFKADPRVRAEWLEV